MFGRLKNPTYLCKTKEKKFFEIKILIVVTLTMKVDKVVVRFIVFITLSAEAS